jgi:hypothetical protein
MIGKNPGGMPARESAPDGAAPERGTPPREPAWAGLDRRGVADYGSCAVSLQEEKDGTP